MEPTAIRALVIATLNALGRGGAKSLGCRVLYRNNRQYADVHFVFEGMSAIWLADSDHIRFIDDSDRLFKVVRLDANRELAKKAA